MASLSPVVQKDSRTALRGKATAKSSLIFNELKESVGHIKAVCGGTSGVLVCISFQVLVSTGVQSSSNRHHFSSRLPRLCNYQPRMRYHHDLQSHYWDIFHIKIVVCLIV